MSSNLDQHGMSPMRCSSFWWETCGGLYSLEMYPIGCHSLQLILTGQVGIPSPVLRFIWRGHSCAKLGNNMADQVKNVCWGWTLTDQESWMKMEETWNLLCLECSWWLLHSTLLWITRAIQLVKLFGLRGEIMWSTTESKVQNESGIIPELLVRT